MDDGFRFVLRLAADLFAIGRLALRRSSASTSGGIGGVRVAASSLVDEMDVVAVVAAQVRALVDLRVGFL